METAPIIQQAASVLAQTESLLAITGAGISAESGLPTFRGSGGVLDKDPNLERVLSAEGLRQDPRAVWEFVNQFRVRVAAAQPNAAHRILAEWERVGRFSQFLIATQNIDGLHQAAGSQRVSELHGSVWQFASPRCIDYSEDESFSDDFQDFLSGDNRDELLRKWSEENNYDIWPNRDVPFEQIPPHTDPDVRPNVLLYDEPYGNRLLWVDAFITEKKPDTVLVIGCSGGIWILQRLLDSCRRANPRCQFININPTQTPIAFEHLDLRLPAAEALVRLAGGAW